MLQKLKLYLSFSRFERVDMAEKRRPYGERFWKCLGLLRTIKIGTSG